MMPSPADLTYFVEVASSQNLSRAAERLGLSQPSLTLAMQRLETAIGTPLFFRSRRGVTLTQAGKQLAAHARQLMQSWDQVRQRALATEAGIEGHYTLGCHVSVALYSLPDRLGKFLKSHPNLELKLIHDLSRKVAERVIQMEVDLGLVINPVRHNDLVLKKIGDDEVSFYQASTFRDEDPILICEPDLLQTQSLRRKMTAAGLTFRRVLETSSLEVVAALAAKGAGVGILPGRVAAQYSNLKKLPKAPTFHDQICLLYRVENKGVKSIQRLAEELAKGFA